MYSLHLLVLWFKTWIFSLTGTTWPFCRPNGIGDDTLFKKWVENIINIFLNHSRPSAHEIQRIFFILSSHANRQLLAFNQYILDFQQDTVHVLRELELIRHSKTYLSSMIAMARSIAMLALVSNT